jgi:hypothetical protein
MFSVLGSQASFMANGFQISDRLLTEALIEALQNLVDRGLKHTLAVSGTKGILRIPLISRLVALPELRIVASTALQAPAFCVRANLFDFSAQNAKPIPWHQDHTIPVKRPAQVEGFGPFTWVDGVCFAKAPPTVMSKLAVIYVSLDGMGENSPVLKLIPGSHVESIASESDKTRYVSENASIVPEIGRGGALVMSPLILHCQQVVESENPCRHIELMFAAADLPGGLEWNERL